MLRRFTRVLSFDRTRFPNWLSRRNAARARRKEGIKYRPQLEGLEERTLLNNRFVVPIGAIVDNQTSFATLRAALTTPGLVAGDTIQIEAGSAPGIIRNADLPAIANLTIQADPAAGLFGTPQITITDPITIGSNQAGFTLRGVNVSVTGTGALTLNANASLLGSVIVNLGSSAAAITLAGSADVLAGSTLVNDVPLPIHTALVLVTPSAGSANRIDGNTFVANAPVDNLLAYQASATVTIGDQVAHNTFIGSQGSNIGAMLAVGATINNVSSASIGGLSIDANRFTDPDTDVTGILLDPVTPVGTVISHNQIDLSARSPLNRGIVVVAGAGTTTSANVSLNEINTVGSGTGLEVDLAAGSTSTLKLKVEGNDFHNNRIGVAIVAPSGSSASVANIDLGGGNQSSLGDNNFSSFRSAGFNSGAIVLTNVSSSQGTISAQRAIFAHGAAIATFVTDLNGNLNTANALTGNAAFVAALFNDVLRQAADTTNPMGAGLIIQMLDSGATTPAAVANGQVRSTPALDMLVDGLFREFLGRVPEPAALQGFVSFIQGNPRAPAVELVIDTILASPEYTSRFAANAAFVQSLYQKLLGRTGGNAEVMAWTAALDSGMLTRATVASIFVNSSEFRASVVQQLYGFNTAPPATVASLFPNLLHRALPPSPAEVAAWVAFGGDVLAIEATFAGIPEFVLQLGGRQDTAPIGLQPLGRHDPIIPALGGEGFSTVPPTGPAELNPYGIAFVPANFPTTGTLQPGDLLVDNFNDPTNTQGTGTTIVRITPSGQRSTFFAGTAKGLDAGLAVLRSGFVIVANIPNSAGSLAPGSLQILDSNGNVVRTLTNSLFNEPWDVTVHDQGAMVQIFVSNVSSTSGANGTVVRIDLAIAGPVITVLDMIQIGSGYNTRLDSAAFVVGPSGLAFDSATHTLYVASEAEPVGGTEVGTIFAIANADTRLTDAGKGTVVFADPNVLRGPLHLIFLPNGDLMTANNDSVNGDPNHTSELVEFTKTGRFVNKFSIDPQAGAAFAMAVTSTGGQVRFATVDDAQNVVLVYPFVPNFGNPFVASTIPPTGPAELNPYGVAFAPADFPTSGTLQPGDLLVANFNDPANTQGTGTTIVRVTPAGQRSTFFTSPQLGLDAGLAVLRGGFVVVANLPDVAGAPGQGTLQILDSNGNLLSTLINANLLDGPWDLAVNDQGNKVQIFVTNIGSKTISGTAAAIGTVTRIDLTFVGGMPVVEDMVQIASGYASRTDMAAFVVGPAGLAFDPRTNTLFVASEAEMVGGTEAGTIFAIPNASTTSGDHGKGAVVFADTAHLHGPLGMILLPNGDLAIANNDSVNIDPTQPSELVEITTAGQFVGQFSLDPNIDGPFALAVTSTDGVLRFAALNDNQNTVSIWSFQTGISFPDVLPGIEPPLGF
jgi:hypothetical protein